MSKATKLSVIIPVFNEVNTIQLLVERLVETLHGISIEILVVDDGSTDGTTEVIEKLTTMNLRHFLHGHNKGKGAAIRTGLQHATGNIVVIQDSDLEYDPADILDLVQPIADGDADVVFGTRFHSGTQRVPRFWHRIANGLLTLLSNMFTNLNLSDMETCYKAFRRETLQQIYIRENRFGVEPELTAKIARLGCRVYQVPISYNGWSPSAFLSCRRYWFFIGTTFIGTTSRLVWTTEVTNDVSRRREISVGK